MLLGIAAAQEQTWHFHGVAIDELGRPLPEVAVCIVPEGTRWRPEDLLRQPAMITARDGVFDVSGPGLATVLLLAAGRAHVAVHSRGDLVCLVTCRPVP